MLHALILAAALQAQGPAASPLCRTPGACRTLETVVIRRQTAPAVEVELNRQLPWIGSDGALGLYLGEVAVVGLNEDASPMTLRLLATGQAAAARPLAAGEVRARLVQGSDFKVRLIVESRLNKPLHFNVVENLITEPDLASGAQDAPPVCVIAPGGVQEQILTGLVSRTALMGFNFSDRNDCYTELRRR